MSTPGWAETRREPEAEVKVDLRMLRFHAQVSGLCPLQGWGLPCTTLDLLGASALSN